MGVTATHMRIDTEASSEFGMRLLLSTVIAFFVVQDVFDLSLSLGPGLSAKNALLYALAATLAFKIAVQRNFSFEIRALHACFFVLIAYSILAFGAAAFVIEYPGYDVIKSAIKLKTLWIDRALLFLVFFYGLRSTANAYAVLKVLLIAVALASTIALANALGITQIGRMGELMDNGRVLGLMGEPNQDAAFGALFLPGLYAAFMMSAGFKKIPWLFALAATFAAVMITASRGGFVAIIASAIWGAFVFRRYVPLRRIVAIAAGGVFVVLAALLAVLPLYGEVLYRRVFGDSSGGDMVQVSSGRTEIWSNAIATMAEKPVTFFTGYGWDVYAAMPFRYAPHNYFVDLWFNLGVIGLVCGTTLLVIVIREALRMVSRIDVRYRPVLMSFAVGAFAIAVATFFVDLYTPWLWFWAYAGLAMRIVANAKRALSVPPAEPDAHDELPRSERPARDTYGWTSRAHLSGRALS